MSEANAFGRDVKREYSCMSVATSCQLVGCSQKLTSWQLVATKYDHPLEQGNLMAKPITPLSEHLALPPAPAETPRHGFRGQREENPAVPWGMTVAISREAGA